MAATLSVYCNSLQMYLMYTHNQNADVSGKWLTEEKVQWGNYLVSAAWDEQLLKLFKSTPTWLPSISLLPRGFISWGECVKDICTARSTQAQYTNGIISSQDNTWSYVGLHSTGQHHFKGHKIALHINVSPSRAPSAWSLNAMHLCHYAATLYALFSWRVCSLLRYSVQTYKLFPPLQ